ncbi:MAG: ATP-binding protein [Desulfotignum sp.]|nr:ATP-binding protein [Desulfotignum sp.]
MQTPDQVESDPLVRVRFEEETRELLVSRASFLLFFSAVLYPCFNALDWLAATHEQALLFLYIRLAVGVNFVFCSLLLKSRPTLKSALIITVWAGYVSILGVVIMTVFLGGFTSHYYVGIVLILFIPGLFLPWNMPATLVYGCASILTYVLLNIAFTDSRFASGAAPFFFMTWSVAYIIFANYEKEKTRIKDLALRLQIEKANENLKALDKAKMRFFSNVSHELRTPLTLILGPLEQLLQRSDIKDKNFVSMLRSMESNGHRLLRQVNTILDFAKSDAGKLTCHYSKGNIGTIINELVEASLPYTSQKNIELTVSGMSDLPDIDIDVEKVETIAANLLSNAIKFTPSHGTISLRAGTTKNNVWFEIQDTGIGIPEEKQKLIFERFLQVEDDYSRSNEGTGLGLAMVRELTLLHGGNLNLRSKAGEGSTFRIELPLEPLPPGNDRRKTMGRRKSDRIIGEKWDKLLNVEIQKKVTTKKKTLLADINNGEYIKAAQNERKKGPSDAPKVLIVEDNPDLRAFIADNLSEKYFVERAENGRLGLDLARRMDPDLIVSDIMMPEMDGYEMCREIRKDPFLFDVPVILVTAKSGVAAIEEGLEIGANDYIPKPFEMRELKARIASQLKNRQLEKRLTERDTRLSAIGQMTSSIVHDLKNPLNTVIGFAQIARQDSEAIQEENISRNLDLVMESCSRLNRMIIEILDFAKGYAPRLNTEPVLLVPFLETTLTVHKDRLAQAGISMDTRYTGCEDVQVSFDSEKMNRVIENLIMNSKDAFFNANQEIPQKNIRVDTTCDKTGVVIRFSDNGPGIPEEIKASIFDPFTTTGKKTGVGLGLSTVRNIVASHSGTIEVKNDEKTGGAVFELIFPVVQS